MVSSADAVPHPRAVVVKLAYTATAGNRQGSVKQHSNTQKSAKDTAAPTSTAKSGSYLHAWQCLARSSCQDPQCRHHWPAQYTECWSWIG